MFPGKRLRGKNALSESEDEPADLLEDPALAEGMDPVAAALTSADQDSGKVVHRRQEERTDFGRPLRRRWFGKLFSRRRQFELLQSTPCRRFEGPEKGTSEFAEEDLDNDRSP